LPDGFPIPDWPARIEEESRPSQKPRKRIADGGGFWAKEASGRLRPIITSSEVVGGGYGVREYKTISSQVSRISKS